MSESASQWLDAFFEHYYRRRPVTATFAGVHEYDHQLPDYSEDGLASTASEMSDLMRRASELEQGKAAHRFEEVDLLLATEYLRQQLWELESDHFQRGNPCFYTGEAAFGIMSLFLRDFAPLPTRIEAAIERCHAIPSLLEQGRRIIGQGRRAWVERAIDECVGAVKLLTSGLKRLAVDPEQAASFEPARAVAVDAFRGFRAHLESLNGPSHVGQYGVGSEAFDRLLLYGHFLSMSRDSIVSYAREQFDRERQQLIEKSERLVGSSDPRDLLAALASQHPVPAAYEQSFPETWERARAEAEDQGLVTWPDFRIEFSPIPGWARDAAPHLYFLYYRSPPPLDDGVTQRYLVPPLDRSAPVEVQEQLLRSVNDAQIKLNHVVHHAGLGHHVQNWYAFRSPSRVGQMAATDGALRIAMFSAGTMAEGWSCYTTELMDKVGFLTPLESASLHHARMRMAARAIVDIALHERTFTIDDAARFYTEQVWMPPAAALAEAVKNSMFPGGAMMYLIGTDLVHQLRGEMQQRWGDEFSLRRFHDTFLSYGSIPATLIGRLMRDEPLEPDELR